MTKIALALASLTVSLVFAAPAQAKIDKAPWGEAVDHQKVDIYTLTNAHGMSARITNYGAFLVSLNVPDRKGKMADVVLGYDSLDGYTHGTTDDFGYAAVENPVHVRDMHATILHLLGFDHEKFTYRYAGLDFRLTGVAEKVNIVPELIA